MGILNKIVIPARAMRIYILSGNGEEQCLNRLPECIEVMLMVHKHPFVPQSQGVIVEVLASVCSPVPMHLAVDYMDTQSRRPASVV